jgi:drug/metabolite transporter (DMT)-like permease
MRERAVRAAAFRRDLTAALVSSSSPASLGAQRGRFVAIGMMCLALLCFAALDSTAKFLSRELPASEIVWARYLGAALVAIAATRVAAKPRLFVSARPGLQALRSSLLLGSTLANFLALRQLQLAETSTISFLSPILVALLAIPLLGERPGRARIAAIALGFVGVLIATRPGTSAFRPIVLVALAGALCNAGYAVATRGVAAHDRAATTLLWTQLAGVVALTPLLPWFWKAPSNPLGWALMAGLGASGAIGHGLLIKAHQIAPASTLAPFGYTQLMWMIASGYFVFGDWPPRATFLGATLVVGCGLFLVFYERAAAKRKQLMDYIE